MNALNELRQRFETLDVRERRFLVAGAIVVLLSIVFLAIVQPLRSYHANLENRVAAEREQVAWMRGAVDVLQERGPRQPATDRSGSLLATADASARDAGLAQALRRIQQDGEDAVRVRLESASFDSVIVWLENLEERYGIVPSEMTVERIDAPGMINASLTLSRNAS
ncbi:MAG: type II secretion system protein M [Proteobacteria bacterium]|nr:type II secretion system protein M [Pseudomonadota bacterium]